MHTPTAAEVVVGDVDVVDVVEMVGSAHEALQEANHILSMFLNLTFMLSSYLCS